MPWSQEQQNFAERLYAHKPEMIKVARSVLSRMPNVCVDDAHDVFHDSVIRATDKWRGLRSTRNMKGWLWQITRHLSFDEARKVKRISSIVPIYDQEHPISAMQDMLVFGGEAMAALRIRSERSREVFMWHYVWGFDYEEIASRIGCSIGGLRIMNMRTRDDLRKYLNQRVGQ